MWFPFPTKSRHCTDCEYNVKGICLCEHLQHLQRWMQPWMLVITGCDSVWIRDNLSQTANCAKPGKRTSAFWCLSRCAFELYVIALISQCWMSTMKYGRHKGLSMDNNHCNASALEFIISSRKCTWATILLGWLLQETADPTNHNDDVWWSFHGHNRKLCHCLSY